jgi:hypothetical protein
LSRAAFSLRSVKGLLLYAQIAIVIFVTIGAVIAVIRLV